MYRAKALNLVTSIVINGINFIMRFAMIALISNMKEDTNSAMTRSIMVGIFIAQFFNTGFVLLLVNANLSETHIPILNELLQGQYTDFNSDWYRDVGITITKTMMINSIVPFFEVMAFWGMRMAFRMLDRKFTSDTYSSKKKSIQQYVDLYSGPEYLIHFRYSAILNTVFVTLMYGTALPMLFPIALFTFAVLYVIEKYMVYYVYK